MPIIDSDFRPPWWLRNGHLQTILPVIWPRRIRLVYTPERLELADGDFLDLDWARAGFGRLAILSHGLESSSQAPYIRGLAAALNAAGWDALAWSFRGCGKVPNRLPRFYHSGETGDLAAVIAHAAGSYANVVLVGFSLGGNVTLKYLGATKPHSRVSAAVAISVPIDLAASAGALDRRLANRIYLRRFLQTLIAKVEAKARLFPGQIDLAGIHRIRSFQEFDDRYTARLHGFRDAADYWRQSSSRQYLARIAVPTLLLSARDDPFLPPACFPEAEAAANPQLFLEAPAHGGHVGFMERLPAAGPNWLERRTVGFFGKLDVMATQS
jgi:predicted alpha/beta-fold hydrolase